jgi:DNA-binding response OmpR family regulator
MTLGHESCDATDRRPVSVALDEARRALMLNDHTVVLTRTQFCILAYLISRPHRWITAAELIQEVLGTHHEPDTALIRVHVHNIRRRLGEAARYLLADRRCWRGYRWCTTEEASGTGSSGTHELRLSRAR